LRRPPPAAILGAAVESDELTQRLRDAASSLEASAPTYPPDELVPGTFSSGAS
jgi:hypothetical protein